MNNIMLNTAWWTLTLVLMPYVLLLTLISILFVWYGPVYDISMRANIVMEEWRYNLFVGKT
jgi:hypothetical protein